MPCYSPISEWTVANVATHIFELASPTCPQEARVIYAAHVIRLGWTWSKQLA